MLCDRFDRPELHVNLKNLRAEVRGDVPLKDRGWQKALEAVALNLKINRLQVRHGSLTYGEPGTFKPLRDEPSQWDGDEHPERRAQLEQSGSLRLPSTGKKDRVSASECWWAVPCMLFP